MNYRHGYHAGNFADVLKHVALVAILLHLRKKETPFTVIDTHAGRGRYDLGGIEAAKTGEAEGGIVRMQGADAQGAAALAAYLALAVEDGAQFYPGSPLLAARLLRPQDRLIAIEKHPEECAALTDTLAPFRNAVVEQHDGYARLPKLLPPASRRGLILIDPPFEAVDEFAALARALAAGLRKFATGIFLVWHPVKSRAAADAFTAEALAGGARALTLDIAIAAEAGRLNRAGLLILNPPYGFEGDMGAAAAVIAPPLGAEIRIASAGI